jgi:hypothetical protein
VVTATREKVVNPVLAAAERAGVPVVVRPWWGSQRNSAREVHDFKTKIYVGGVCNGTIVYTRWGNHPEDEPFCLHCGRVVDPKEVKKMPGTRKWECPGGINGNGIRRPEIIRGVVVAWEGPCGYRNHHHEQVLKVIDVGDGAFLLEVRISKAYTRLIIGVDDGHPYVTPVNRSQQTLQDAFDWLVPVKVRDALILGKDVKRQGDWFFVPYEGEPRIYPGRPVEDDKLWRSDPPLYRNFLNRNAYLHYGSQTRHRAELAVYKSLPRLPYPAPIVKGTVTAPDHPPLVLETWHIAVRHRMTPGGQEGVD